MRAVPLPRIFLDRPIAHRGFHDRAAGRPDNSLAAARAAIERGYGIELDVQPSRDGVAMVFHDYTLDRLTGRAGRVADVAAAELQETVLAGGDEGIPTLAAFLEMVAGRVPVLIEVKPQDHFTGEATGPLEEAVARALAGYAGPAAVMSFNPHSVAALCRLAPDVPRGLTTWRWAEDPDHPVLPEVADRLRGIPDYGPTGSSFISHEAADLSRPRVLDLKAQGAAVLCWTIRSPGAEAEARRIADNITFEGYAA